MGGVCNICRTRIEENEIDLKRDAYEKNIKTKAMIPQTPDDLEKEFEETLKHIEYPNANVKVLSLHS